MDGPGTGTCRRRRPRDPASRRASGRRSRTCGRAGDRGPARLPPSVPNSGAGGLPLRVRRRGLPSRGPRAGSRAGGARAGAGTARGTVLARSLARPGPPGRAPGMDVRRERRDVAEVAVDVPPALPQVSPAARGVGGGRRAAAGPARDLGGRRRPSSLSPRGRRARRAGAGGRGRRGAGAGGRVNAGPSSGGPQGGSYARSWRDRPPGEGFVAAPPQPSSLVSPVQPQ